jgi:hypothetical protein
MKRLSALPFLLILVLSACPSAFSPSGGVSGDGGKSGGAGAVLGGGGDGVAPGGDVPGGAIGGGGTGGSSGAGGGDVRPKADPEPIAPIRLTGGDTATPIAFRAGDGYPLLTDMGDLAHPFDLNVPKTFSVFDGSISLRILVQGNFGSVASPNWRGDISGHVRVVLARSGVTQNEWDFCDVPLTAQPDGSNLNVSELAVMPGYLNFYYRYSPYPASQWVDCNAPVTFSSISDTAFADFSANLNSIEYVGGYRIVFRSLPTTGGTGTGGLPE